MANVEHDAIDHAPVVATTLGSVRVELVDIFGTNAEIYLDGVAGTVEIYGMPFGWIGLDQYGLHFMDNRSLGASGSAVVTAGASDPSAGGGIVAPLSSMYMRRNATVGELWVKTGAAATAWTKITP